MVEGELRDRLRLELGPKTFEIAECAPSWGDQLSVRIETNHPADVLTAIASYVTQQNLEAWLDLVDLHPLERAIRRLLADLDATARR
ncbi:hypothetical protein LZC95_40600 [Pendulispora brunnea]|uniref:WYL domain-containing protein n=1 Tax=Pendulispora brunnea TaxID=2905690 RepID=A0ABZ2K6H8_9BACT